MPSGPENIKNYEKRFGTIAIEKGYITLEQLIEALSAQVREESQIGQHRLIGTILFDLDYMTGVQVEEVVSVAMRSMKKQAEDKKSTV